MNGLNNIHHRWNSHACTLSQIIIQTKCRSIWQWLLSIHIEEYSQYNQENFMKEKKVMRSDTTVKILGDSFEELVSWQWSETSSLRRKGCQVDDLCWSQRWTRCQHWKEKWKNVVILMKCSSLAPQDVVILYMHPANERRRYNVTSSLIGWMHTQNDHCFCFNEPNDLFILASVL